MKEETLIASQRGRQLFTTVLVGRRRGGYLFEARLT